MKLLIPIVKDGSEYANLAIDIFGQTSFVYFECETADGYTLYSELSKRKQALISMMLFKTATGTNIDYISKALNKLRTENEDQSLSSILRELDSTFQEFIDLAETKEDNQ